MLDIQKLLLVVGINNATGSIKGMYHLYVKTHNKTGLKYLGQTTRDPFKYPGSGKRWVNHLMAHGNDVSTEILFETNCKEELKKKGIYYSNLWNVTKSDEWANLTIEEGTGGNLSDFIDYKCRDTSYKMDPDYKKKVSDSVRKAWRDKLADPNFNETEFKLMCSNRSKNMWAKKEISESDRRLRSSIAKKNYADDPLLKTKVANGAKASWDRTPMYYEVTFPDGSKEIIKFLRRWCKENNLNYSKLYNTLRYNTPSTDGWMVNRL